MSQARNHRRIAARIAAEYGAPSGPISNDDKAKIARIVRAAHLPASVFGGCIHRAACGWLMLRELGVEAQPVLGGLVYNSGNAELRYCDRDGRAVRRFSDVVTGHHFLLAGSELVDFSCGDWRGTATINMPARWDIAPMFSFLWCDASRVMGDPSKPAPGRVWYGTGRAEGCDDQAGLFANEVAKIEGELLPLYRADLRALGVTAVA